MSFKKSIKKISVVALLALTASPVCGQDLLARQAPVDPVSYYTSPSPETPEHLVCRLLLEKKKFYWSQPPRSLVAAAMRLSAR